MNNPIRVVEGNTKPFEPFWRVRDALQTGGDPEIEFYGYISEWSWLGDDITPKKFREDLYAIGKGGPITVRINSGGGEIFAASAIRSTLLDYPGFVTVKIDGLAASAAVAVALAGDKIHIFDTAYMMVHNPGFSFLLGWMTADVLEKFSEQLKLFKDGLLNAYMARTGMERELISKMLDDETWMTAQQAVDLGFADEVITGGSPIKQDVQQAVRNYINVPPALLNTVTVGNPLLAGQAPGGELQMPGLTQERERLATQKEKTFQGANIMNIRDLMKERESLLARATKLVDTADAESRDFTEDERAEYQEILGIGEETGKLGALNTKIEAIRAEREKLRAAAEKNFSTNEPIKPDNTGKKTISRAEYEELDQSARAAFIKSGGRVEE
jgi:ATP-dependent Clp protease protease subunit